MTLYRLADADGNILTGPMTATDLVAYLSEDDDVVAHNHFDERDARDDCPACKRDVERAEGGL